MQTPSSLSVKKDQKPIDVISNSVEAVSQRHLLLCEVTNVPLFPAVS